MSARLMRNAAVARRRSSVCEEISRRENIGKASVAARRESLLHPQLATVDEDTNSSEEILSPRQAKGQFAELISAISSVYHRKVTGLIDEFISAKIPMMNHDKLDILMAAVQCQNLEILNVVTDVITPGRNFPNDYIYRLLMAALQTNDENIIKKMASCMRFKFSMTKVEFFQLIDAAIKTESHAIVDATFAVIGRRNFPNLLAHQMLTDATKTTNFKIVVDVLKNVTPKKPLSPDNMLQVLSDAVRTGNMDIVKAFFHWKLNLCKKDKHEILMLATKANKRVFDFAMANLNPVFSGMEWRQLLQSATKSKRPDVVFAILTIYKFKNETIVQALSDSLRYTDIPTVISILKTSHPNLPMEVTRDILCVAIKFGCEDLIPLVSSNSCFAVDTVCDGIIKALTLDVKTSTPNSSCNTSTDSPLNESTSSVESQKESDGVSTKPTEASDEQKISIIRKVLLEFKLDHSIVILRVLKHFAESDSFEATALLLMTKWENHGTIVKQFLVWAVKELDNHKAVEATLRYNPTVSCDLLNYLISMAEDNTERPMLVDLLLDHTRRHYPDQCLEICRKETTV